MGHQLPIDQFQQLRAKVRQEVPLDPRQWLSATAVQKLTFAQLQKFRLARERQVPTDQRLSSAAGGRPAQELSPQGWR